MAVQRVGPRPSALVHQAAAGFTFDGTQPTSNVPVFNVDAALVFPTEAAGNGSGLFEYGQDRPVVIVRVHVEVPSADVAGWSLFVTDGALDVLVESSTATSTSYTVASIPIILMRGESLKLVMVGVSAGLIKATVVASTVDNSSEIPRPAAAAAAAGPVISTVDTWEMQRVEDPGNDTYRARRSNQLEEVLAVHALASVVGASAGGSYFLDVRKNSTSAANGTSVLSAQLSLEGIAANTWVAATVKADGSEDLAVGDDLRAWLISDNADLTGYTDGVNVCVSIGPR